MLVVGHDVAPGKASLRVVELLETVRLFETVERRDVGVAQRSEKPGLPLEPRNLLAISRDELRQKLQRHIPAERGVASPVDRSHASFAELLDDLVVAERSPDHAKTYSGRVAYIFPERSANKCSRTKGV